MNAVAHTQGEEVDTAVGIRDATVTVRKAVDGTRTRKQRSDKGTKRPLVPLNHHLTVDPRVMAAAKAAMLPGQRLVIVSETEVRLVNS